MPSWVLPNTVNTFTSVTHLKAETISSTENFYLLALQNSCLSLSPLVPCRGALYALLPILFLVTWIHHELLTVLCSRLPVSLCEIALIEMTSKLKLMEHFCVRSPTHVLAQLTVLHHAALSVALRDFSMHIDIHHFFSVNKSISC